MADGTGCSVQAHDTRTTRMAGRRTALMAGLAASPMLLVSRPAEAAGTTAFQDITKYGADPTGTADSSAAIFAAFAALPATGGCLYCPAGLYLLAKPVYLNGKPVTLKGDGSNVTTFMMNHTGVAFTFVTRNIYNTVNIAGLCIAGPQGALASGAISVTMPAATNETGYQSCSISDVSIGSPLTNMSNGCQILCGLRLANVWKCVVSNTRMFGPFNTTAASSFVTLASPGQNGVAGKCIDNHFVNCVSDGPSCAFNVTGYAEGVHIVNCLLIGDVGFSSAAAGNLQIAVLGLYMSGCEVQCTSVALQLNQIWSAWIGSSHLGAIATPSPGAVVNVVNCVNLCMSDLWITGNGATGVYGMIFSGGAINRVNGLTLENLASGVAFTNGVSGTLVLGIQMVDPNNFPILLNAGVVSDTSGNVGYGSNNAQWLTSLGPLRTLY